MDCVVISDLYLFEEILLLNPCFIFFLNVMLSFIDKVTTGIKSSSLFIWNVVPVVCIAATFWTVGLVFGLSTTPGVIDMSDIPNSLDYSKWQIERSPKITQIF